MFIPDGISVELTGESIRVKGPLGTLEKRFNSRLLKVEQKGNEVIVSSDKKLTREVLSSVKTTEAHIRNMFEGVQKGYEKKLVCIFAHFPVSLEVKGSELLIKNFLGERVPRKAKIMDGVKVEAKGSELIVSGPGKEDVGQTARNIINATKVKGRDQRIFQDGIYLVETG
ncbi:50S ribosomal protein L6 [Candidatus Micrarchaeota archaeon]|nr:50S ribosomal protein L6 [Candidatus Micrarchaeota archaeon]